MTEQQTHQLMDEIDKRSKECERGVVAVREDGRAGIAVVSPNCLMYAWVWNPEADPLDYCLS